MDPKLVSSALEIPGYDIVAPVGIVRGIVVRSRSVVGNFFASFQIFFGGDITVYTNLCEQARLDAYRRMCEQARANKANAIIGFRYDATELMPGVTEVLAYGTAVVVKEAQS